MARRRTVSAGLQAAGRPGSGPLAWRGVVEGFYGEPWSLADRRRWFAFGGGAGLDRYVYAPKDDPWHRERWREPYPADRLEAIAALDRDAAAAGVRFVYAISPGLSMRFDEDAEHDALAAKCRQLRAAGIRSFALLFDDVPMDEPEALGRAHGDAAARFVAGFLRPEGLDEPVLFCPTDYAGLERTPYRAGLATTLPEDALVLWTGADIVVAEVTASDILRARRSFGRDLVLWDNFPVNDFDRSRVFLGPLTGREWAPGLAGILANPMVEAAPSRFALATVAEWMRDPQGYDATRAADRAFDAVAGDAAGLRALVEACSAWPPSAPRWPALSEALDADRYDEAEGMLVRLAGTSANGAPADLAAQLDPWVRAAVAAGRAGVLACRILAGSPGAGTAAELDAARRALEAEFADVARDAVLGLVDAAATALGVAPPPAPTGSGASVAIVTGANPAPGDRELAEWLRATGMRVADPSAATADADLAIVTRTASESDAVAAAALPIPVLAWGHLVAMGLALSSAVPLSLDRIAIADPGHPAAAGLTGEVTVYRGRSRLTWGVPPAGAEVVATDPESGNAVIAVARAGAELADGSVAPATRASFFLGADGLAPWLVTERSRALLRALIRTLLDQR